jgi:hypothetical protein
MSCAGKREARSVLIDAERPGRGGTSALRMSEGIRELGACGTSGEGRVGTSADTVHTEAVPRKPRLDVPGLTGTRGVQREDGCKNQSRRRAIDQEGSASLLTLRKDDRPPMRSAASIC